MLATGHSLSGAAAGYTGCLAVSALTGYEWNPLVPHAVAVVVAGWALFPDCDTRKATVTTSLGWPTIAMHRLVVFLCAQIYFATATEYDGPRPMIHRGATHTWPGALAIGLIIAAICLASPRWSVPAVLGISLHVGMRGLYMPTSPDKQLSESRLEGHGLIGRLGVLLYHYTGVTIRRRAVTALRALPLPGKYLRALGRTGTFVLCLAAAVYTTETTRTLDTPWAAAFGVCATLGMLVHCLGDSVTEYGVCWKFPFVDRNTGRRWEPVRLPKWLAFKAGWTFELAVVYPLCIVACILAMPGGYVLVMTVYTAWRTHPHITAALPFAAWPTRSPPTAMPPPRCVAAAPAASPQQ